ncbi:MAG: L-threonylcarbamoyladenylate synthase [Candidatus Aenigmatarchaeota archaeon]
MQRISLAKIKERDVLRWVKEGKIFLYPTDTVYGLGCDATNKEAVARLRKMKGAGHPFSVIVPSKRWATKHLYVKDFLSKLPGPYTIIALKRNPKFLFWVSNKRSLGIRIPDHPFTKIIQKTGKPFITTSANISGQSPIKSPDELLQAIKPDIIIDAGMLSGRPSDIIDITGSKPKIIKR